MTKAMSKEDFRLRYNIPKKTFIRCLRLIEKDMPPPYTKTSKILTPAQVAFLIRHLCAE